MDTPVSGGVAAAAGAKLSFMCGGAPDAFERAKPLLGAAPWRALAPSFAGADAA